MAKFSITLTHRNGPPQSPPNPAYPNGIDLDQSLGKPSCKADLPYPAEERGVWMIKCQQCGTTIGVTAAGRRDDPRSVKVQCRLAVFSQ